MYTIRLTAEQLHALSVALETEYAAVKRRPVLAPASEYETNLSSVREAVIAQSREQYGAQTK